jgi:hypothetical protein
MNLERTRGNLSEILAVQTPIIWEAIVRSWKCDPDVFAKDTGLKPREPSCERTLQFADVVEPQRAIVVELHNINIMSSPRLDGRKSVWYVS